jgi:hypothetical protein
LPSGQFRVWRQLLGRITKKVSGLEVSQIIKPAFMLIVEQSHLLLNFLRQPMCHKHSRQRYHEHDHTDNNKPLSHLELLPPVDKASVFV